MENLVLRGGKFYRGSEIVPLEFGNIEQINLIRKQEKILNAINGEGLILDVWVDQVTTYTVKADFVCTECNTRLWIDEEVDDEDDKAEILGEHSCHHCKAKYKISMNKEGEYVVKSLKK